MSKFEVPERIKKKIKKEIESKSKSKEYLYMFPSKNKELEEILAEDDKFAEAIQTLITSKAHNDTIHSICCLLNVEGGKMRKDENYRPKLITPDSEQFSNTLKEGEGLHNLLTLIDLEPTEKFNTWKIPSTVTAEGLLAKVSYLYKLMGNELSLERCNLEMVSKRPTLAKLIFNLVVDCHTCKSCNYRYTKLLMHILASDCKDKFTQSEIGFLKEQSKSHTKYKAQARYQKNKEKIAAKYQENKQVIAQKHKENREENLKKMHKYYNENREVILDKKVDYYAKNRTKLAEKRAKSKGEAAEKEIKEGSDLKAKASSSSSSSEVQAKPLIRKRKRIDFTMEELENEAEDEDDEDFAIE